MAGASSTALRRSPAQQHMVDDGRPSGGVAGLVAALADNAFPGRPAAPAAWPLRLARRLWSAKDDHAGVLAR